LGWVQISKHDSQRIEVLTEERSSWGASSNPRFFDMSQVLFQRPVGPKGLVGDGLDRVEPSNKKLLCP
jgi:hypothetical protein